MLPSLLPFPQKISRFHIPAIMTLCCLQHGYIEILIIFSVLSLHLKLRSFQIRLYVRSIVALRGLLDSQRGCSIRSGLLDSKTEVILVSRRLLHVFFVLCNLSITSLIYVQINHLNWIEKIYYFVDLKLLKVIYVYFVSNHLKLYYICFVTVWLSRTFGMTSLVG